MAINTPIDLIAAEASEPGRPTNACASSPTRRTRASGSSKNFTSFS